MGHRQTPLVTAAANRTETIRQAVAALIFLRAGYPTYASSSLPAVIL